MNEVMENIELGLCVKNQNKEVLYQDQRCIKNCGDMKGQICTKGCMESYAVIPGMTLIKNSKLNGETVDAVVINDCTHLTTLLYQHNSNETKEEDDKLMRAKLVSFGLSKSELAIFLRVLKGARNADIMSEFFISKATLKTHLNNIDKKLPESFQQFKKRR